MTDPALVRCEEATVGFATRAGMLTVLQPASCAVLPGRQIAVSGPSGSGKTTLLHLLGGLQPPDGGTVSWPGLGGAPGRRPDLVGIALQGPSLLPPLDVTENVMLPLLLAGVAEGAARRRAGRLLAEFGLSEVAAKLPEELSGGQASRVGIVRALVARPALVLADEPTGQLDTATAAAVIARLVDSAAAYGAALVVATHDPAVAARLGLRWRLDDGVLHTCPGADR